MRRAIIAVVGWLAFFHSANAQYPLYPSQAYPGGKETQRWHLPPPQTPSYYASATGPSREVGYPTSLYGPAIHFTQQVVMPPPYLAFAPSAGMVPGQTDFSPTNPNLTADRSGTTSRGSGCSSCGQRTKAKKSSDCEGSWWEKHVAAKASGNPKGCYGSHFSMACGSFSRRWFSCSEVPGPFLANRAVRIRFAQPRGTSCTEPGKSPIVPFNAERQSILPCAAAIKYRGGASFTETDWRLNESR